MEKYVTFWPRLWAGFIDGLILLPLIYLDGIATRPERSYIFLIIWGLFSYSAYWLYSVILHARSGQTVGKMFAKVKVLDVSEERIPTFRQAFLRDIGYIFLNLLSFLFYSYLVINNQFFETENLTCYPLTLLGYAGLGWFALELITMLTNKKRRALHDYIAGTVVVLLPDK